MDRAEMERIFKQTGLMLEGHFLLTSGRHSNRYMQCAKLFQYPEYSEMICKDLAGRFAGQKIDLVVGPAVGGIIMSYEMARQFNVPNIFAERENGAMTLRRGFSIPEGAKVLVVEDVVTTGGSVREVMDIVAEAKAEVVGVCVVVDRSGGKIDFGVPFEAAYETEIQSYEPSQCPLCEQGLELVKPGSRKLK
ncbi:MAG: orotate phosphoribosyltransferase [Clostridiales bacterium]|nr:orotate phosphoribosyltransferase [Clostridiales bacterium]